MIVILSWISSVISANAKLTLEGYDLLLSALGNGVCFFGIRDAVGIEFSVQGISICFFRQRELGFKQLKLGNHSRTAMIIASCL